MMQLLFFFRLSIQLGDDFTAFGRCNELQYTCPSGKCIDQLRLCDGEYDCPSGEDELGCDCASNEVHISFLFYNLSVFYFSNVRYLNHKSCFTLSCIDKMLENSNDNFKLPFILLQNDYYLLIRISNFINVIL